MYNPESGNCIRHFTYSSEKEGAIHPNTLTLLGEDYLVGAITTRPALKVCSVSKAVRIVQTKFILEIKKNRDIFQKKKSNFHLSRLCF